MADRIKQFDTLKAAKQRYDAHYAEVETLLRSIPEGPISVPTMDEFMRIGDDLEIAADEVRDALSDMVWEFAFENDEINLQKYE